MNNYVNKSTTPLNIAKYKEQHQQVNTLTHTKTRTHKTTTAQTRITHKTNQHTTTQQQHQQQTTRQTNA